MGDHIWFRGRCVNCGLDADAWEAPCQLSAEVLLTEERLLWGVRALTGMRYGVNPQDVVKAVFAEMFPAKDAADG